MFLTSLSLCVGKVPLSGFFTRCKSPNLSSFKARRVHTDPGRRFARPRKSRTREMVPIPEGSSLGRKYPEPKFLLTWKEAPAETQRRRCLVSRLKVAPANGDNRLPPLKWPPYKHKQGDQNGPPHGSLARFLFVTGI